LVSKTDSDKKQKSFWKEQVTLALENDIRILTEKIEQEVT